MPVAARFHSRADEAAPSPDRLAADAAIAPPTPIGLAGIELAYASVEPGWDDPVQLALASLSDDPFGMDTDAQGDDEEMPESVLLPLGKPERASPPEKPSAAPEPPARKPARTAKPKPEAKPDAPTLAYARPDKPAVGAFKNLFNAPGGSSSGASNGVAVYDISAGTGVYMPDGSRLEAHSGIGAMAGPAALGAATRKSRPDTAQHLQSVAARLALSWCGGLALDTGRWPQQIQ